ncbi:ABC transporter ATP-binding protein [Ligilactobacillus saerimneri]|uniref:ABC transporter ATP-binding protein n=1 Tax=Ligilactobacillus saerimneri TaxID=228229 RepID=UPI0003F5116C|nr:ABC transporter ATP-binding protein [Ligilactobacillus saerimneri]KRL73839.1 multidrug protein lipid ABC transporter family ATP-binding and permease [Ligilactobacillus saerimneri DSM 16049]
MRKASAIQYFKHYLAPYWRGMLVMIVLSLLSVVFEVVAPLFMGRAVTALAQYVAAYRAGKQITIGAFQVNLKLMILMYSLFLLLLLASWLIAVRINSFANHDMRVNLFKKFQRLTIKYFDTHQDGKLLSLFTSDLDNIFNALNNAIFELIAQVAIFAGTIWLMLRVNVQLALVTMALTPVALLVTVILMRKSKKYIDLQQEKISALNGYVNEQINGQKVIITNGLQQQSIAGFNRYNDEVRTAMFKGQLYSGMLNPLLQGLSYLNLAIVIAAGSVIVMNSGISRSVGLGLIVTFVQFSQQYFSPLTQLASIYSQIQLALTGAKRIDQVEIQPEEDQVPTGQNLAPLTKKVAVVDAHFGYQPDKEILHGIDLNIPQGTMLALVGPTGSGKTTVMNLFNRFYDVDQGCVTIDEQDVRTLTLKSLRSRIGIVLQDSVLFTGTVAFNIKFGKPAATDEEMIAAAKQANIHDYIMTLPQGYATEIDGEQGIFSTGQKQLLSIARTLLTDPDFLILDEATANVDTVTEAKIQAAMDNIIAGRTSFVIAHRLKTIINADQIAVLKDGNVVEQGNHAELLAQKGFYYKLYTNQMVLN